MASFIPNDKKCFLCDEPVVNTTSSVINETFYEQLTDTGYMKVMQPRQLPIIDRYIHLYCLVEAKLCMKGLKL